MSEVVNHIPVNSSFHHAAFDSGEPKISQAAQLPPGDSFEMKNQEPGRVFEQSEIQSPLELPADGGGKTLKETLEQEHYVNSCDSTAAMLHPALAAAITPEQPDPSFSTLVNSADATVEYTQKGLKYVDPEGDANLIRRIDTIPEAIVRGVFNSLFRDSHGAGAVMHGVKIGREKPIKVDALVNRIIAGIQAHSGIIPSPGREHEWSPQAAKYNRTGFWRRLGRFLTGKQHGLPAPLLGRSKLFLCLACGFTSSYLVTGKEQQLEDALMRYGDHSVKIDDLFNESYMLNGGDLYLTLLTAENLLSEGLYTADRAQRPLQKKLMYIRNDSPQKGDNFGAWYHFFGAALYGYMRPAWMAKGVVGTESLGSLVLEGRDRQENFINVTGAECGHKLRRMMEEEGWKNTIAPFADTDYMNLT